MPPLPKDISYQKLYEPEQNIWFLNWILKQRRCDTYLNQIILSIPFTVKRYYYNNGQLDILKIFKNEKQHSLEKGLYDNGTIWWKSYFKNGKVDGLVRTFFKDGQLDEENNWKNDKKHGRERLFTYSGQLVVERFWKNGQILTTDFEKWSKIGNRF